MPNVDVARFTELRKNRTRDRRKALGQTLNGQREVNGLDGPTPTFYDDSSGAMSLGHNAVAPSGTLSGSRLASGGIEKHFAGDVERIRTVTRERIEKLAREHIKRGIRPTEARRLAQEEIENPQKTSELKDYDGAHQRFMRSLMNADLDVDGGTSSSAKFKPRKTGTHVCPNCHLEGCQCYRGPGRPFADGRSDRVKANVRQGVKEKLVREGVSAGRCVQAVVDLSDSLGVELDTVVRLLEATKANPERVAALFERAKTGDAAA